MEIGSDVPAASASTPARSPEVAALAEDVRRGFARLGRVLVVLDDDPTGSQSVAGVPVLTTWEDADVDWALGIHTAAVYVLTNTRSLPAREAADLNREIVARFLTRAEAAGVRPTFVSRSDSTLRGHFPLETDTIRETLEAHGHEAVDGTILLLAFPDAGRVTIRSTHYVRADTLVPVSETEFARDATFGFTTSYLPAYVEQKSAGRVAQADVVRVTLADLRGDGRAARRMLTRATDNAHIVVDAEDDRDLLLFAAALNDAEAAGKTFIYRSGPQFVRARIGQRAPLPMRPQPPGDGSGAHGLVVVGSHTAVTTRQLEELRQWRDLAEIQLDVARALDERLGGDYLHELEEALADSVGRTDTVISTSRTLVRGQDEDDSLDIARQVSEAVIRVVGGACARVLPRFVVAKGGITASDVAKHALGIRRAMVEGPVLDGIVSFWRPVDGIMRGQPFVVFAGNVGEDDSLVEVIDKLGGHRPADIDVAAGG